MTLCSYDPLVTPLSGLCADNKLRYTMRHGYEFFFEGKPRVADRPIAWSKVGTHSDVAVPTALC